MKSYRFIAAALMLTGISSWAEVDGAQPQGAPDRRVRLCLPVESPVELPEALSAGRTPQGYSVGNFGIAAVISDDGLKVTQSLINPPVLGQWLQPFGEGELSLSAGGTSDFALVKGYAVFPENLAKLASRATGVEAQVTTFAPLSSGGTDPSELDSFIPSIVIQIVLSNPGATAQSVDVAYQLSPEHADPVIDSESFTFRRASIREVHQEAGPSQVWLMSVPQAAGRQDTPAQTETMSPSARGGALRETESVRLKPRESKSVTFVIGVYDPRGYSASRLSSRRALQRYLLTQGVEALAPTRSLGRPNLRRRLETFVAALPRTGDAELDVYLRWYLSAAVFLTKGVSTGEVLTMGYAELNQRDSYWTTGAHLVFWPDLERKMLQESMALQSSNGQVPMTILPVIERENNIDGNEYFILRIARFYRWYRDRAFLQAAVPHVKSAVNYLLSLDREHIGVPRQTSFWADWKDVPGVEGRLYAPHFAMLWLAALKEARFLAAEAADPDFAAQLGELYDAASERINRDVSHGGLWSQTRYVDRWEDGRVSSYTLEDQTVGAIFGVIPAQRLASIYSVLNSANESEFGVRETYPYLESFKQDYGRGEYHNGGIWPYLNFADAWGRFKNGYSADAERILKKVGYNDLVRFNDYSPSEFLNGDSGKNAGFPVQAWDADFFSAIYFGAFGLERVSRDALDIHVTLTNRRDFRTAIQTPNGEFVLCRVNGAMMVDARSVPRLHIRMIH